MAEKSSNAFLKKDEEACEKRLVVAITVAPPVRRALTISIPIEPGPQPVTRATFPANVTGEKDNKVEDRLVDVVCALLLDVAADAD